MAGGWAKDGAEQEQMESTLEDAVQRARSQLPRGESLDVCEECGDPIPEARRKAIPGYGSVWPVKVNGTSSSRPLVATTAAVAKTASCVERSFLSVVIGVR
ncbi:hypothetical protein HORIV_60270 [Vreelandella olivaria]|uniref:Zinc finger DksA/TraR C4-type domain-containing protein n=1 Tax=Vreelandella olivaria TaxID=390919 RepID=A0ABN5X375_9GAMM|nr:hypothetical protein HORIV_60270 [Halomonas olivaria]